MRILLSRGFPAIFILILLCDVLASTGCSSDLPRGVVGNTATYNYSPSVIQTGDIRQVWWCSFGWNPTISKNGDNIFYESMNTLNLDSHGPVRVLAETPQAWDSAYTCNPKVIGGVFKNPLGDGQTYSYAMYYVATSTFAGIDNSIGVAFSNDGVQWNKYPQPVVPSTSHTSFGVGQPAAFNTDHKSSIQLFYEDSTPAIHHVTAISSDGVHFQVQGTVTTNGLDPDDPLPSWGDMAYDSKAGEWYAVFNRPLRPLSSTGGVWERGQYGIELYKIPQNSLLTGTMPWQQLAIIDTNATGFESNFIAGFVRDLYGTINLPSYPTIQMYTSVSYPAPAWNASPAEAGNSAGFGNWVLVPMSWDPSISPVMPFDRYFNGSVHEVTTGWIPPDSGFQLEKILGKLYARPLQGANVAFYGCDNGEADYFISLDVGCEGQRTLGTEGYAYSQPVHGLNLVALYRCRAQDHFVSRDSHCEGQTREELLGYVLP
jgi:hypothetical protein